MRGHRTRLLLLATPWMAAFANAASHVLPKLTELLQVGPLRAIRSIGQAARQARPGFTIEVDAGEYVGDVAVWTRDDVTVRAVGGRVRLLAGGASAEGKGTWVVRAKGMRVEGFDFEESNVADRNGAGIRLESGSLHVSDCRFLRNEMGLLTGNDPTTVLEVHNSEFAHNQRPDGHNHNLYAGRIGRLSVTGCYFHHARSGHLLKSRAAINLIQYNRLTDETGGSASYELEFANGGLAIVVGNIIEQGPQTENIHLISFGAEGYSWPRNAIYLANNTLVNPPQRDGVFLRVAPGADAIHAANNLLVGAGRLEAAGPGSYRNNLAASTADFQDAGAYDYRLKPGSSLVGKHLETGHIQGHPLDPTSEYLHPRMRKALGRPAHNPGAMQSMLSQPTPSN